MKHRIKKHLSLIIALSMLLSLIPFYGAAVDDEFAGYETLEEIPFEFELEPGDLPFEQLKNATLAPEDIPSCIDPALAEARGHVNRLYLQEPDDYTVMFQNVDGSKTIYVFSQPVNSSSLSTTAAITVNGGKINFSGSNIITSRIGTDLRDYNIGYCEIQTLPSGILSADGVDITEDARGWARGESMPSALSYNISSEAAAEYAASITLPDTEISTAALVPGTTITPITPAPLTGATVMSISYSDLAGLMSFKNVSTNQYLTLTHLPPITLTTRSGIVEAYSQWLVTYDLDFGHVISNLSNVNHTYLGFDDMDNYIIDSMSYMMDTFTISIESSANSIVTIDCGQIAINSTGALYEKSEDDDYFPTSCQWQITNKDDCTLVNSILPTSSVRIEQSETLFDVEYTLNPTTATHYDIGLYDAANNTMVDYGSGYDFADTGVYTMYYKDKYTGVRSVDFVLIIVDSLTTYAPKDTYSITPAVIPAASNPLYLTRNASGELILQAKNLTSSTVTRRGGVSGTIMYQDIQDFSRTFTFDYVNDSLGMDAGVCMAATRSTSQYTGMPQGSLIDKPLGRPIPDYTLTYTDDNEYAVDYDTNNYDLEEKSSDTPFWVCDMGGYYLIISDIFYDNNGDIVIMALKSNGANQEVTISELTDSDDYKWNVFFVGIDVPVIKQTHNLWCGPTSFLQVLYGADLQDSVTGDTLNEQQLFIRSKLHDYVHTNEATYMDKYETDINNSDLLPLGYICEEVNPTSSETQDDLRDYINASLQDGMACIFFTVSAGKPYKVTYNEGNPDVPDDNESLPGHLECIIGYDPLTDTVIINNCHYMESRIGLGEIRLSDLCADMERLWYFEDTNN